MRLRYYDVEWLLGLPPSFKGSPNLRSRGNNMGMELGTMTHFPLKREFLPLSLCKPFLLHIKNRKSVSCYFPLQARASLILYLYHHHHHPGPFLPVKEILGRHCGCVCGEEYGRSRTRWGLLGQREEAVFQCRSMALGVWGIASDDKCLDVCSNGYSP